MSLLLKSSPVLFQNLMKRGARPSLSNLCPQTTRVPSVTPRRFMSTEKKEEKSVMTWRSMLISLGIGGAFLGFMLYVKKEKEAQMDKKRKRELGMAKIGGEFDLVDMNGVRRKSEDYRGKWLLIYFGFTRCPDICPDELEKLAKVIDTIDKQHPDIDLQALFITVDPDRDSPAIIKAYLEEFHPKILGLTGTKEELAKTTKSFRVYFSAGPTDQDEDYIVDHTVIMYLVGPDGSFVDYYGQNRTANMIVDVLNSKISSMPTRRKEAFLGNFFETEKNAVNSSNG